MSICRTIFKKLYKKDILDDVIPFDDLPPLNAMEKKYCHLFEVPELELMEHKYNTCVLEKQPKGWLFSITEAVRSIEQNIKSKPLIRHTFNPRYRKYKAYLERCYG